MPTHAQRLIHAVRQRNHERLQQVIRDHGEVDVRSAAGRTALHAAAEEGDGEAVRLLLEAGADVNARTHDGLTPLHQAAANGGFRELLDPDLDRRDCSRRHPVKPETAAILMQMVKEKSIEFPDDLGPLDTIPGEHRAEAFSTMLDFFAQPEQLLREFAARGFDIDAVDPDMAEQLRGHPRFTGVVELLLDHGADSTAVDKHGNSVLRGAVELGRAETIEMLLSRRTSKTGVEDPASLIAATLERSRTEIAEVLLKYAARFEPNEPGLLHAAAMNGRASVVRWLLDHGSDINLRDEAGNTPLLAAAGHTEVFSILLGRGADIQVRNQEGNTGLHVAVGSPDCLKPLLSMGLAVNERNQEGRTALHLAASDGSDLSIRLLLQAGAIVNAQDHAGNTPLHAVFHSYEYRPDLEFPLFQMLVASGADRSVKNQEGKTAFDLAVEIQYPPPYLQLLDPTVNSNSLSR